MLTPAQAGAQLGIKPTTLESWRARRVGPEYVKLGDRPTSPVRYSQKVITAYIKARTVETR